MSTPLTLAQLTATVGTVLEKHPGAHVVGIRSETPWAGVEQFQVAGRPVRVAWCVSTLAVREQMARVDANEVLVVVTDRTEDSLGADVVARLAGRKLRTIKPWDIVREVFHAKEIDPRVVRHEWLAQALLECAAVAAPAPVRGGILDAETAWGAALSCRFGFDGARLDVAGLLAWSTRPDAVQRFRAERDDVSASVLDWVEAQAGTLGRRMLEVASRPEAPSLVALGLVLRVLYAEGESTVAAEARIRLEAIVGRGAMDGPQALAWARAAEAFLENRQADGALVTREAVLAERILDEVSARSLATRSALLPSSLDQRLDALAELLREAATAPGRLVLERLERALVAALEHRALQRDVERSGSLLMAARVARWLVAPVQPAEGSALADLAEWYADEGGFVDLAREVLWSGDSHLELNRSYRALVEAARARREVQNHAFGAALAEARGHVPDRPRLLAQEDVLEKRVAPLANERGVLLVVLDGMSFAVADVMVEDLAREGFVPLVPVGQARPDVIVTVLPSITEACRTTLLCGRILRGHQAEEREGFAGHAALRSAGARSAPVLFHRADIQDTGGGLADDVRAAVAESGPRVVGVVLNAIDDHLLRGDQAPHRWRVADIPLLRQLLDVARGAGRVIVLTGDHGHMLDRDGECRLDADAGDRYRGAGKPPVEGEVLVEGPRVLAAGQRVVLACSERIRFSAGRRNGYHGGAAPQEALVPLVVLSCEPELPAGFEEVDWRFPTWWEAPAPDALAQAPAPTKPTRPGKRPTKHVNEGQSQLFAPGAAAAPIGADVLTRLLASPLFADQKRLAARQNVNDARIRALLEALLERGGTTTVPALRVRLGLPVLRMNGFLAVVRRVLNVDGVAVLTVSEDGQSVTLDLKLMADQFGIAIAPDANGLGQEPRRGSAPSRCKESG